MLAFQGLQCMLMGQITYMALNAVDHCITSVLTVKSQATHIGFKFADAAHKQTQSNFKTAKKC